MIVRVSDRHNSSVSSSLDQFILHLIFHRNTQCGLWENRCSLFIWRNFLLCFFCGYLTMGERGQDLHSDKAFLAQISMSISVDFIL